MNRLSKVEISKDKFYRIVVLFCFFIFVMSFVSLYFTKGQTLLNLIWHVKTLGVFPDLSQSVYEAKGLVPYSNGVTHAIYPPLTYLFLSIIGEMIPGDLSNLSYLNPYASFVYAFFYSFMVLLFASFFYRYLECERINKFLIVLLFFFSSPFIYGFERGNLVILSSILCSFYIFNYESDNKILRELSMISLAVAVSLKLYPVVLGLLLIICKKYKQAARCVIYGAILFFVPFLLMKDSPSQIINGMFSGISFFQNLSNNDPGNWGYSFRIGFSTWINMYGEMAELSKGSIRMLTSILVVCFSFMLIIGSIYTKEKWKKVLSLMLIIIIVPGFSWIYNVVYILPVGILFINDIRKKKFVNILDIIYSVLFLLLLIPLPFGEVFTNLHGDQKVSLNTFVISISCIILVLLICIEVFVNLYKIDKEKKSK